jgi:hypothetical protein
VVVVVAYHPSKLQLVEVVVLLAVVRKVNPKKISKSKEKKNKPKLKEKKIIKNMQKL